MQQTSSTDLSGRETRAQPSREAVADEIQVGEVIGEQKREAERFELRRKNAARRAERDARCGACVLRRLYSFCRVSMTAAEADARAQTLTI